MSAVVTLPLPYQLTPNTLADADQVMADLNYIANQVNANIPASGQVRVSPVSTLLGYLTTVLSAGSGVTFTIQNPGGAEVLQISSNAAQAQLATITAAALCL